MNFEKNLYFLRHAIAVDRGTPGIVEEKRPLTEEGRKKMIQAAKGMRKLELKIDVLMSSPLTRALQTATIVQEHLPFSGEIEIVETLCPGADLEPILSLLRSRPEQNFVLTGHEPTLSLWIETLLGCGYANSVLMKKGALAHLKVDLTNHSPQAELIYLLQPKMLRRLA